MSPRHTPGQPLTSGPKVRDTQAVLSAGCTTSTEHDHGERYDGHDALFPDHCWDMDEGRFG